MKDTESIYEKNVKDLISLLKMKGEKIKPTEVNILDRCKKELEPYFLPKELVFLYENMAESQYWSFDYFLNIEEALKYRDVVKDEVPALLTIGGDSSGGSYFMILSKVQQVTSPIYYMDVAEGHLYLYLHAYSLNNLIELEIERLKILHSTGEQLSYRDLYLKFMPDAYPYPWGNDEKLGQNGYYSKNGVRNIYNILEKEDLPKEWLE